jgi:hypothetical protein
MPTITVSAETYALIEAASTGLNNASVVHNPTDNTYSFTIDSEVLSRLNTQRFANESTSDTIIRLAQSYFGRIQ